MTIVEALLLFAPLGNPAIYGGDDKIDNIHLRKVRLKTSSFLTG